MGWLYSNEGATTMSTRLYFLLSLVQLNEGMQQNIMGPVLPFMVAEFLDGTGSPMVDDVEKERKVGIYVGFLACSFYLGQFISCFFWAKASDKFGRRPILIFGCGASFIPVLVFGVSRSYRDALASRTVIGMFSGNAVILKTYLGEVTTKENQARAYSILPITYGVSTFFGPLIGGLLGGKMKGMNFAFLPSLSSAVGAIFIGVMLALFLPETAAFKTIARDIASEQSARASYSSLWSRDIILTTCLYGLLCTMQLSFVSLLPLFFRASRTIGGLELSSDFIGILFAVQGIALCTYQFTLFPRLAKRSGIVRLMKVSSFFYAFFVPLPVLFPYFSDGVLGHWVASIPLLGCMSIAITSTFTSIILLMNNAGDDNNRSLVNGLGQTLAALGKCFGSASIGIVWSKSVALRSPSIAFVYIAVCSFILFLITFRLPESLRYPKPSVVSKEYPL